MQIGAQQILDIGADKLVYAYVRLFTLNCFLRLYQLLKSVQKSEQQKREDKKSLFHLSEKWQIK